MLEWGVLLPLRGVPPAEGFSEPGKKGLFAGALEWGFCLARGKNGVFGRAYRSSSARVSANSDQSIGGDGGEVGTGGGVA